MGYSRLKTKRNKKGGMNLYHLTRESDIQQYDKYTSQFKKFAHDKNISELTIAINGIQRLTHEVKHEVLSKCLDTILNLPTYNSIDKDFAQKLYEDFVTKFKEDIDKIHERYEELEQGNGDKPPPDITYGIRIRLHELGKRIHRERGKREPNVKKIRDLESSIKELKKDLIIKPKLYEKKYEFVTISQRKHTARDTQRRDNETRKYKIKSLFAERDSKRRKY